jgi:hypothetical protein
LLFKPRTYCEIGIKNGYVYNVVAPHVERAIAVDIRPFRGIYKGEGAMHYQMSSLEFGKLWLHEEDKTIDFLFIDADHRYQYVIADFGTFSTFVPEHTGLILLHDTYPITEALLADGYCSDAWKAARQIRKKLHHLFEIITLPGPRAGLSIIRKCKTHGWMDETS